MSLRFNPNHGRNIGKIVAIESTGVGNSMLPDSFEERIQKQLAIEKDIEEVCRGLSCFFPKHDEAIVEEGCRG